MIKEMMNAVTNRLYTITSGKYPIYTRKIRQNLEMPCFYVRIFNPGNDRFLGCRRHHQYTFLIQYIAGDEGDEAECHEIFEGLMALECISISFPGFPETILEGKVSFENITDGVMTVLAGYDFYTYEFAVKERMHDVKLKQSIALKEK